MLGVILKKGSIEFVGSGHEVGTLCCVYKHRRDDHSISSSLKYDVIRMLIRGTDYSHSLCFHVCNGSSHFHLYSKKTWLSFCPQPAALIVTAGDQTQVSLIHTFLFFFNPMQWLWLYIQLESVFILIFLPILRYELLDYIFIFFVKMWNLTQMV